MLLLRVWKFIFDWFYQHKIKRKSKTTVIHVVVVVFKGDIFIFLKENLVKSLFWWINKSKLPINETRSIKTTVASNWHRAEGEREGRHVLNINAYKSSLQIRLCCVRVSPLVTSSPSPPPPFIYLLLLLLLLHSNGLLLWHHEQVKTHRLSAWWMDRYRRRRRKRRRRRRRRIGRQKRERSQFSPDQKLQCSPRCVLSSHGRLAGATRGGGRERRSQQVFHGQTVIRSLPVSCRQRSHIRSHRWPERTPGIIPGCIFYCNVSVSSVALGLAKSRQTKTSVHPDLLGSFCFNVAKIRTK